MQFISTPLEGGYVIEPKVLGDDRGWFMRTYCKDTFSEIGHSKDWVQMNQSYTQKSGSVRGMHFQKRPYSEIKLVRCVRGRVYDVIVDIREDSKTFLKWFGTELSAENKKMMYVPEGFAHGFQTLSDDCELVYCHSQFYKPEFEDALHHNDPMLGIIWPLDITEVSERDKKHAFINVNFKGI